MTTVKPIPLDEALIAAALLDPGHYVEARVHLRDYLASNRDVNRQVEGRSLLEISAINGWVEETESLLARGADVHMDNNMALRLAALKGHTVVVRLLLDHGADVHANNEQALRWAAVGQHKTTTEVLLMAGANAVVAIEHAYNRSVQNATFVTIDACAAAIQTDQRQGLLKAYGKQMPALATLVRQEQRRSNRWAP